MGTVAVASCFMLHLFGGVAPEHLQVAPKDGLGVWN